MKLPEVVPRITAALNRACIPYMLTGSFASAFHGSLRSTQDIDFVIAPTAPQLQTFIAGLSGDEYYSDVDAALEAHQRQSLFNVVDLKTGWKIDMIIRKSRPFSHEEFTRRQLSEFEGVPLFVASAEDVVLSKLEWAKLGESQRQIEDAAGILKLRGDSIDRSYLHRWVRELALEHQWTSAHHIAES